MVRGYNFFPLKIATRKSKWILEYSSQIVSMYLFWLLVWSGSLKSIYRNSTSRRAVRVNLYQVHWCCSRILRLAFCARIAKLNQLSNLVNKIKKIAYSHEMDHSSLHTMTKRFKYVTIFINTHTETFDMR